ncbi:hypothetical protein Bbelb_386090 [Branchiostoma belcheri]|nr:hypothetical protein Bbelb_386090 [Branchiostoma belcheri]
MVREKNVENCGSPEAPKTKRYRTRSGKTKPWNTPAKEIKDFEQVTEDHIDSNITKVCCLKFRTTQDRVPIWIDASKAHFNHSLESDTGYKFAWKIGSHSQLSVTDPTRSGDNTRVLTIHFYNTGTILIQGKGSSLFAKNIFPQVKKVVSSLAGVSLDQNGGLVYEELEADNDKTIDDSTITIDSSPECEAPAMTVPNSISDQTTVPKSTTMDPTSEASIQSENTTPKSLTSPSIRRVLGGLENILLTPFSKVRESASNPKSRRVLKVDPPKDVPPSPKLPRADSEDMYTRLVDELNNLKTLVYNNKTTMDKQGKLIEDLQTNIQNKKKVIDKQAQQIEKLPTELQHQQEVTKKLTNEFDTQKSDQKDNSRIQRLYAEIVAGDQNKPSPAVQVRYSVQGTQTQATPPPPAQTNGNTTASPLSATTPIVAPVTQATTPPATSSTTSPAVKSTLSSVTPTQNTKNTQVRVLVFADSIWNDVDSNRMFKHKSSNIMKSTTLQKAVENINM